MVHALVFDMDGTLIESHGAITSAYRAAVLAAGGPEVADAEIIAAFPIGPPTAILAHLLDRAATDDDIHRYYTYLATSSETVAVYDGIAELLSYASPRVALGLFTGASRHAARILLDRVGLLGQFRTVVGGDEVGHPKPEPDGVHLACRRLGVEPARSAYVGDSPLDLEAARRGGVTAVAAAWGHQYDATAPADVIAHHPRDVLALIGESRPNHAPERP